jgi:pSer/pThr/pTyr-binding forkhead associated (FHA) protein
MGAGQAPLAAVEAQGARVESAPAPVEAAQPPELAPTQAGDVEVSSGGLVRTRPAAPAFEAVFAELAGVSAAPHASHASPVGPPEATAAGLTCGACGRANEPGHRFCVSCGSVLSEGDEPARAEHEPARNEPARNEGRMVSDWPRGEPQLGSHPLAQRRIVRAEGSAFGPPPPEPEPLVASPVVHVAPAEPLPPIVCARCQGVLPGGTRFCKYCGAPLAAPDPAAAARARGALPPPAAMPAELRSHEASGAGWGGTPAAWREVHDEHARAPHAEAAGHHGPGPRLEPREPRDLVEPREAQPPRPSAGHGSFGYQPLVPQPSISRPADAWAPPGRAPTPVEPHSAMLAPEAGARGVPPTPPAQSSDGASEPLALGRRQVPPTAPPELPSSAHPSAASRPSGEQALEAAHEPASELTPQGGAPPTRSASSDPRWMAEEASSDGLQPIGIADEITRDAPSQIEELARSLAASSLGGDRARGKQLGRLVVLLEDGSEDRTYPIHEPQTDIGRSEGDVLFTDDRFVSERHARILRVGGRLVLRDLASTNGVYLRIRTPYTLRDGDLLVLGLQVLQFRAVSESERALGQAEQNGTLIFGSPSTPTWGRLLQRTVEGVVRDVHHLRANEVALGREIGDIVFTSDPFLSRRHAVIRRDPTTGRAQIVDLDSSNGVYVATRGDTPLVDGDYVRIGQHLLRVYLD